MGAYVQKRSMGMVAGVAPIRAALVAIVGGGLRCHYRLRAEGGLTVEMLHAFGLVKPIRRRIPPSASRPIPLRVMAPNEPEGQGDPDHTE